MPITSASALFLSTVGREAGARAFLAHYPAPRYSRASSFQQASGTAQNPLGKSAAAPFRPLGVKAWDEAHGSPKSCTEGRPIRTRRSVIVPAASGGRPTRDGTNPKARRETGTARDRPICLVAPGRAFAITEANTRRHGRIASAEQPIATFGKVCSRWAVHLPSAFLFVCRPAVREAKFRQTRGQCWNPGKSAEASNRACRAGGPTGPRRSG